MVEKNYEGYLREQLRRLVAREPLDLPIQTAKEFFYGVSDNYRPKQDPSFTTVLRHDTAKLIKRERSGRLTLD